MAALQYSHFGDAALLHKFTQRLERQLRGDFPRLLNIVFVLQQPRVFKVRGEEYVAVPELHAAVPYELYRVGGMSSPDACSIVVFAQACKTLEGVVNTALHEAGHVEYAAETCEIPNQVAAENTARYLTLLR